VKGVVSAVCAATGHVVADKGDDMSDETTALPPLPAAVQGVLARLNVEDDEVHHWAGDLAAPTTAALHDLLTALEPLMSRLAARVVEGSSADQRGVTAALIVRCWALAVWSTVRNLRSVLDGTPPLEVLPGSEHLAWLSASIAADPAAAQRDGLDLLADGVAA
jgi:hypothetical protein